MSCVVIKSAAIRALLVALRYLVRSVDLLSLNKSSHSDTDKDVTANRYIENSRASKDLDMSLSLSLASKIWDWSDGVWTIFMKGLTRSRKTCHSLKMWPVVGCCLCKSMDWLNTFKSNPESPSEACSNWSVVEREGVSSYCRASSCCSCGGFWS
jgi:hypothetical protein